MAGDGEGACAAQRIRAGLAMDNGKAHCQFLKVIGWEVTKQGRETAETSLLRHKSPCLSPC